MAKDLIELVSDALSTLHFLTNPHTVYEDVIGALERRDWHHLLEYEANLAVVSQAYQARDDYFFDEYGILLSTDSSGEHVAELLSRMVVLHSLDGGYEEGLSYILAKLESSFERPEFCAKVLSKKSFKQAFLEFTIREARGLLQDVRRYPQRREWTAQEKGVVDNLSFLVSSSAFGDEYEGYEHFLALARTDRHPLYATNYTLLIPESEIVRISDPIEQAIMESTRDPSLIYRLTPRDFERFIARIWEGFGFNVELTAPTRDGGADIVCVASTLGVPLKVAIEVKRYNPSKPVSVELVRAFVGANKNLSANKLVYVTTSRYTRDARKYALSPSVTSLLELAALPDIINWANQFKILRRGKGP